MEITTGLASRSYATAKTALEKDAAPNPMGAAADRFVDAMAQADRTAVETLRGEADPHALVEALAQSQLAVETAVSVRNKVVEAYQEILRMPV
ncbi:MAG: flagellar hook-basal body complex protein FliE [Mangrovicoccus sp.]|nr:flagellar hook-basal body complex protein FliE [Mangrovicoccus sp.]